MASHKVSKRSASYTKREIHIIMEEYIRRKNILENNSNPQQNTDHKRKAWVEIAEHVNVISPNKRTYIEVRKKVNDMKSSAKRKILRYLKLPSSSEEKVSATKPQIDERLLEILFESGAIPPYRTIFGLENKINFNEETPGMTIPASTIGGETTYSPSNTAESLPVTNDTLTPSGYSTDLIRPRNLQESVDRLTSSVDRLSESLVKICKSLEKVIESNQQMFNAINCNVVKILESQRVVQSSQEPRPNNHQR